METDEIIEEIQKLPVQKRIYIIERCLNLIGKQQAADRLEEAANELYEDYINDDELTAFTALDFENFYEAR